MSTTTRPATGITTYSLAGSSVTAELAVRASDGSRFKRYQERTPRGYRWTAWESTTETPVYTPNGHDPTLYDVTGSGWVLSQENASVRLPATDGAVTLRGWVAVAHYRSVGCDGSVKVWCRPNDVHGVEVIAGLDVERGEVVSTRGSFPARHTARLHAIGREALRQMLAALGPETCAYLETLREETRAAGPEWVPPPDHLPCSLTDYTRARVEVTP